MRVGRVSFLRRTVRRKPSHASATAHTVVYGGSDVPEHRRIRSGLACNPTFLRLFAGDAVLMYIMWYGTVRTLLETYRVNNWTILGVPTAMWIGIIGVVLAAGWFWYRHRRGWGSPMIRPAEDPEPEPATQEPHPEPSAG